MRVLLPAEPDGSGGGFGYLFRTGGEVDRGRYLFWGIALFGLKHNLDRIVASGFGKRWSPFNYWDAALQGPPQLLLTLALIALPFIWIGVTLTLRRLRHAGLPGALAALFFVPVVNLLFFMAVAAAPPRKTASPAGGGLPLGEFIPHSPQGSAAVGLLVSGILTAVLTAVGAMLLGEYGSGLFMGLPFLAGVVTALIHGYHEPRSLWSCVLASAAAVALAGALIFLVAIEGAICLAMAAPLAFPLAALGAVLGWALQRRRSAPAAPLAALLVGAPLLLGAEYAAPSEPPVRVVTTAVDVAAPPETVWRYVVAYTDLPAPDHWIFKFGYAYPVRVTVEGSGIGARRSCTFSTGSFIEPIEAWEEGRLLRFAVTETPPPMVETGIRGDLKPPHLEGYFKSLRGQFRLTPLPGGKTRLEGTTWYSHRIAPSLYWGLWSDFIVHRIHDRVFHHIRARAEAERA